jgi:murein L,D-transpeptidase YafK
VRRSLLIGAGIVLATGLVLLLSRRKEPTILKADRILVEKSARRLTLLHQGKRVKSYSISLGWNPIGHKEEEGDGRTPEGVYSIDFHKPESDYHRALHISYPSASDRARAIERGVSPGGDIMIHGLRNGTGAPGAAPPPRDWTAGCIAVTDQEIEEIYRAVADGTPIDIRL